MFQFNFPKKAHQIVGLDLDYFLKSGFWVSLRYVLISLSGLLLSIGFARWGNKELFGQYQSLLAFIALISVFSLPGLALTALRSAANGQNGVMVQAVKYSFYTSLIAAPIIFGYAFYEWYIRGEITYALGLFLGGVFFPFLYSTNKWYVIYEANSHFRPVTWRSLILSITTTLGILLALYFNRGLLLIIFIYFFSTAFLNGVFFFEAKKKTLNQSNDTLLDVRYAVLVSLQKFIFSLSENLPVLAITFLFGFEMLALFQVSFLLVNAIAGFLGGISSTYLPLLFRYKSFAYGKIFLQNIVIGFIVFIFLRFFIEIFFLNLYGEAYREALVIAERLSWLVILFPMKSFLINYFTVKDRNQYIIIVSILANTLSLGIFYYLKNISFQVSVVVYMVVLQLTLMLPLLGSYCMDANASKRARLSVREGQHIL